MDYRSGQNNDNHIGIKGAFFGRAAAHFIRKRWWWLGAVILVTAFMVTQMSTLEFDNAPEIWFVEDHDALKARDRFHDAFGNDRFVFLLFSKDEMPFNHENLKAMTDLALQFETEVPYATRVTWLGNVERIRSGGQENQEVLIEQFMPEVPRDQKAIEAMLLEALDEPAFVNDLISKDGSVLTMVVELESFPSDKGIKDEKAENPNYTVALKVDEILANPRYKHLKPHVAGGPHFNYMYDQLARRETSKLFLAVVGVQALLLLWLGRGLRGVVVPLVVTVTSVLWTMGAISLLGYTLNLLSTALPIMLICVGIGDSVHGIAAFYDHFDKGDNRKQALRKAFSDVGGAVMLTSLTTAAGFLAYLTTHLKPYREMGIYIALGVVFAFLLTIILTPIFYSFGKEQPKINAKRKGPKANGDIFDKWLAFTHRIVMTKSLAVVVVFGSIMVVTFFGYLMMEVESNTAKLIFKREPLRQTLDFIDEHMGTSTTLEYLIDTRRQNGIKDPEFMGSLDELMTTADAYPLVTKAVSITDLLKRMRRSLHGNQPEYYKLPETRNSVAQHLFLYEGSGGATLDRLVGFTYDMARLSLKMKTVDTGEARALEAAMRAKCEELFGGGKVEIVQSGGMSMYLAMNDILYEGQSRSFLAALTAITLMMILVLRSIKLGLISMVPNLFPVFLTMGFMGLAGFYMDVITISFAAIIIGVAVDDTIHFFTRFRSEFIRWGTYDKALKETYASVGRPITFTTLILIIGTAVFTISSLLGFFKLGILFGFAFLWALLADFYFAPALIVLLKPLGQEREEPEFMLAESYNA